MSCQPAPWSQRAIAAVFVQVRCVTLAGSALLLLLCGPLNAAQEFELRETAPESRAFLVESRIGLDGKLQTSAGEGKAISLTLAGNANFAYHTRALPSAGRDEKALRSLRWYDQADATVQVSGQTMSTRLDPSRRLIVAGGGRAGVTLYAPSSPLTYGELELLRSPADPLAILAVLPPTPVTIGQSWQVASWAAQMLAGHDVGLKHELTCELESVDGNIATIRIKGGIEGAILGAASTVKLDGTLLFDLANRCVTHCELVQTEERSVGTVSPGMNVTAKVSWDRKPSSIPQQLQDAAADAVPLDPPVASLALRFESPWNLSFLHGRNWHVFYRNREVAVLRLLDRGSLVAQCNISPIPSAPAGEHTPVEQFQADIQASLGEKLTSIQPAERLPASDGRSVYRVVANGQAGELPMQWIYYLCAAPSGKQLSLVFAVESKLLESLGEQDREMVRTLQFEEPSRLSGNSR